MRELQGNLESRLYWVNLRSGSSGLV